MQGLPCLETKEDSRYKSFPNRKQTQDGVSPTVCILINACRVWSYTVIKTVVLSVRLVNFLEDSRFLLKEKFRLDLGTHSKS